MGLVEIEFPPRRIAGVGVCDRVVLPFSGGVSVDRAGRCTAEDFGALGCFSLFCDILLTIKDLDFGQREYFFFSWKIHSYESAFGP